MGLDDQAKRSANLVSRVRSGSVELLDHPELLRELRQAVERERGKRFGRVVNTMGGVWQPSSGYYYRESPDGHRLPVAMPKTDPRYEAGRRERWARGVFTPEDEAEFGPDLLRAARETLAED